MPNWVFNELTVEGSPDLVTKLMEQVNMPFTTKQHNYDVVSGKMEFKDITYSNPVFAFWNIVFPTDLEAYMEQPVMSELDVNDPNWWSDIQKKSKTDDSWYNWNYRNWGVKWDVAVTDEEEYPDTELLTHVPNGENSVAVYKFQTAWGFPDEAMKRLSFQYPTLLFTLDYEEETGWGGEVEFLRGEILSLFEYENKCPECDVINIIEYCEKCGDVCSECLYGYSEGYCPEHVRPV